MSDPEQVDTGPEISHNSATDRVPTEVEAAGDKPEPFLGSAWADEPADEAGPDDDEPPAEDGDTGAIEDSGEPADDEEAPGEEAQKVPDRPAWLPAGFDRPEDVVAALQQAQSEREQYAQYARALHQQQAAAGAVPAGQQPVQEQEGFRPPYGTDHSVVRAAAELLHAGTKERAEQVVAALPKVVAERAVERARYLQDKRRAYDENPELEFQERFAPLLQRAVTPIHQQFAAQQAQSFIAQNADVLTDQPAIVRFDALLKRGAPADVALSFMRQEKKLQELSSAAQKVQSKAATQQAIKDQSRRGGRKQQRSGHKPEANEDPFEWGKRQIRAQGGR